MKPDILKIVVGSRVTFVADAGNVDDVRDNVEAPCLAVAHYQIISVEPPAFDWSSVKPGMRFGSPFLIGYVWYVGPNRLNDKNVVVDDEKGNLVNIPKSDLTPAPEDEG